MALLPGSAAQNAPNPGGVSARVSGCYGKRMARFQIRNVPFVCHKDLIIVRVRCVCDVDVCASSY